MNGIIFLMMLSGALPEQIDPGSGSFPADFPQVFSHVGLISSGVTLSRLIKRL